jgi:hypothetical protein
VEGSELQGRVAKKAKKKRRPGMPYERRTRKNCPCVPTAGSPSGAEWLGTPYPSSGELAAFLVAYP